jgi:hypothetical protein
MLGGEPLKDIKTKEVKKDIKTLDKSRAISERVKNAASQTKVKSNQEVAGNENSPNDYASDRTEQAFIRVKDQAIYQFNKQGQKGLEDTKQNISKARDYIRNRRNSNYSNSKAKSSSGARSTENHVSKLIKQPSHSLKKMTAKTAKKHTIKTTQKSVKTAEKTSKVAIKKSGKAVQKTAQAAAKTSQKATQAARAAAKATVTTIKAAAKATIAAVKAIITGTKALVAAIAAGGWVAVVIIVVICLIALIVGSCFGIFFASEDKGSDMSLQQVIREINEDYQNKLETIKVNNPHDDLVITGTHATWQEVLSVYAVKTATDPDNPQEVATMTEGKKRILTDIFWEMNAIGYHITTHIETEAKESYDDEGNITEETTRVTKNILYITITHKTVDEMALKYNFNADQIQLLNELLDNYNDSVGGMRHD